MTIFCWNFYSTESGSHTIYVGTLPGARAIPVMPRKPVLYRTVTPGAGELGGAQPRAHAVPLHQHLPPGFLHIRRQKRQTHASAPFVQPIRRTLLGSGVPSWSQRSFPEACSGGLVTSSRTAEPLLWWGSWQLGSSPQCLPEENCDVGMTSVLSSCTLGGPQRNTRSFQKSVSST